MTARAGGRARQIDWFLVTLLGSSAAYFIFYFLTDPARGKWFSQIDQGAYLAMAEQLSHFGLQKTSFLYGIGYPLAAVPSLWLGINGDPFFLFNLFAFVFAAYATYQAGRRFVSPAVGALAAFLLVFATPLINYTIVPWNSSVSLVAFSGLLLIASRPASRRGTGYAVLGGALVAWAFAARYIDLLWVLPLAAVAVARGSARASVRHWGIAAATALVLSLPVLALHQKAFGSPLKTPYSRPGLAEQSLDSYKPGRIPEGAVGFLVGSDQAGGSTHHRGLLTSAFWFLAAIPGAWFVLKRGGRTRFVFGTAIAVATVGSLFYLSYRAAEPDQWRFGTTHYFKMFWPLVSILAATAVIRLWEIVRPRAAHSRR